MRPAQEVPEVERRRRTPSDEPRGGRRAPRPHRRSRICVAFGAIVLALHPAAARAATLRRIFEPEDMEFEEPGMAELDMAFGLVRGQNAYRVSLPDFELDVGLTKQIELDIDGELALGGPDTGALVVNSPAQDNLWTAVKVGVETWEDKDDRSEWALGFQLGPIWPIAPGAEGVGVQGMALVGARFGDNYFAVNLGGVMDPGDDPTRARPAGFVGGVDMEIALDKEGQFALDADIGGVDYFSPDPSQLGTTLGFTWSVLDDLDLSITGLYGGWLPGGDRWGFYLGITPRFRLW